MKHILCIALVAALTGPASAAGPGDLLDEGEALKYLRVDGSDAALVQPLVDSIRAIVAAYQWEHARRTNEGRLWQGHVASVKELHEVEFETRKHLEGFLDSLKSVLDDGQRKRLQKVLDDRDDLLGYAIQPVPFRHINNSPLFSRFQRVSKAYRVVIPGEPEPREAWSYGDLLDTWTTRGYVQYLDTRTDPTLTAQADIQYRETSPALQSMIVRSPVIAAATLFVPDLARREFEVLWDNYEQPHTDREAAWAAFRDANRLEENILVRLKLATPLDDYYLRTDRYIIYLEDSEGVGYEPLRIAQESHHKLEALEINLPGRQVEVTDVFGTYTGMPGYKEWRWLEAPAQIRYAGQEKLLKLFFPGSTFMGEPVVKTSTDFIKLIIKPEDEAFPPVILEWQMKRKPPKKLN